MNATCTIRKKSNLLYNQRLCRRNPAYQMAWNQQNHHNRGKCGQIDYNVAKEATREMLLRPDRPDAILAFNDTIVFAAFTAIKQLGLRIPDDVALIGFTDDLHAAYVTPRMSAIVDQSHLMGSTACRLLLRNIGGDGTVRCEVVPQKLVIRETSAKRPIAQDGEC